MSCIELEHLWGILHPHIRLHSALPSSRHQMREYLVEEWCSSRQSHRELVNPCQGALKLSCRLMVARHLTDTSCFSSSSSRFSPLVSYDSTDTNCIFTWGLILSALLYVQQINFKNTRRCFSWPFHLWQTYRLWQGHLMFCPSGKFAAYNSLLVLQMAWVSLSFLLCHFNPLGLWL